MQDLAGELAARGYADKRVGVELENYYFSAKAFLTLREELPNASFVDATGLVNWQRAVKSGEEITFMRKAALISEKIMDGIYERAVPGMRKSDLVAEITLMPSGASVTLGVTIRLSSLCCRAGPMHPRPISPGMADYCHTMKQLFSRYPVAIVAITLLFAELSISASRRNIS